MKILFFIFLFFIFFLSFGYANENIANQIAPLIKNDDNIAEQALAAIEKKYSKQSFNADFIQISKLTALDIIEQATGKAYFSYPFKMRWHYIKPDNHEIITNGKFLWIYRPLEKQVMVSDAKSFFTAGKGGIFLSNISLLRKNYILSLKKNSKDYLDIKLVAKQQSSDVVSIVLRVLKENNEITQVITTNTQDDITQFEFFNIRFEKVDADMFELKNIKEDIDMIKMN